MAKEAFKVPKQLEPKTQKNIETDLLGDKLGRVHVDRQDLDQLQSRKMKGLKKRPAGFDSGEEDEEDFSEEETPVKKAKKN